MITCFKFFYLKNLKPLFFHHKNTQLPKIFKLLERGMATQGRPKIFLTRSDYPPESVELLRQRCDLEIWHHEESHLTTREFVSKVKGVSGIYVSLSEKVGEEIMKAAGETLKVIATISVGVDHIDLASAKKLGIKVGYTPDVLTEATAELTMALLLATSRRLFEANKSIYTGGWKSWAPLWMCGPALDGSTAGIFGLGRIGTSVAKKLRPFGVKRILYTGKEATKAGEEVGAEFTDFDTFTKESDFIIVTCALTPETQGAFNAKRFAQMKPNVIFINTARGGVVNQESLIEALRRNKIAGAGLDVMFPEPIPVNHPLTKFDNCVLTPHIGSATIQTRTAMGMMTAKNILAALDGQPMAAEITLPSI